MDTPRRGPGRPRKIIEMPTEETPSAPQDQEMPASRALNEGPSLSVLDQNAAIAERFMQRTAEREDAEADLDETSQFLKAQRAAERSSTATERELIVTQLRKDKEREAEVRQALAEGRRIVAADTASINVLTDTSLPLDRDGRFAVEPTQHTRWVRLTDGERASDQRAHQFRKSGYTPVLSKVDGKPIVGPLGLLMETTRDQEAARRAEFGKRVTSLEDLEKNVEETVARTAREVGLRPGSMKTFKTGGHNPATS